VPRPVKRVTSLIMAEILPFADPRVLKLDGQLERAVYDALKPAWSAGRPVVASGAPAPSPTRLRSAPSWSCSGPASPMRRH
jgi:hypothetical protein